MNKFKKLSLCLCAALAAAALAGCMGTGADSGPLWYTPDTEVPKIPEKLQSGEGDAPRLNVYVAADHKVQTMDIEDYVMGVVAGEMKNDWPMEALKAQAILARTFVLKFCQDKSSKYEGADISTDVSEAQAYAARSVNYRVRQAVQSTRGEVMSAGGEYPYAWFHAHSGGMTELPSVALDFDGEDPPYLRPRASVESDRAPEDVQAWTASFTPEEVRAACADVGLKIDHVESVQVGRKGESGRAATLKINGESVSAPSFRIQIGANRLKSTLIDDISVDEDRVTFQGRGFGHGVGLSQWGAYAMAEQGQNAGEIIEYYFPGVDLVWLW